MRLKAAGSWTVGGVLLMLAFQAQAILIQESGATATTSTNSNLGNITAINNAFGTSFSSLSLIFKANDVGGSEEGSLSGSYNYVNIQGSSGDRTGGDIVNVGNPVASCPTCILIVKDGNNSPAQYLFNLGSWNGTDILQLRGFWAGRSGAISNVAIWAGGTTTRVPEPGTLALMGAGLLALGLVRRRNTA